MKRYLRTAGALPLVAAGLLGGCATPTAGTATTPVDARIVLIVPWGLSGPVTLTQTVTITPTSTASQKADAKVDAKAEGKIP